MPRLAICILLALTVAPVRADAPEAPPAPRFHVIANPGTIDASLTAEDLARIFMGRKTLWSNGTRVAPAYLGEKAPSGMAFLDAVVHRSPVEFRTHWRRTLLSGGGTPPRTFKTQEKLVEFVARQEGAIGVVETPVDDPRVTTVDILP